MQIEVGQLFPQLMAAADEKGEYKAPKLFVRISYPWASNLDGATRQTELPWFAVAVTSTLPHFGTIVSFVAVSPEPLVQLFFQHVLDERLDFLSDQILKNISKGFSLSLSCGILLHSDFPSPVLPVFDC